MHMKLYIVSLLFAEPLSILPFTLNYCSSYDAIDLNTSHSFHSTYIRRL